MRYELQINEWTDWIADRSFDTDTSAKLYARERYAQNEWRIYDKVGQRVVHQHDPSEVIREMAGADLNRFERVTQWTETHNRRMDRAYEETQQRRQRDRLRGIASQQRRQRRRQIRRHTEWDLLDEFCYVKTEDKVNWLQEGF